MELIQTKKWINMAEVEQIAEFSARANNGAPDLNWNKVMEKINRDRSATGIPSLRQRCFVAIMKAGGADDGRIRGWSKRKYLKSIGYKEQTDIQEVNVPQTEVPSPEKTEAEKNYVEPESSAEAEEMTRLSADAIALLKFFVNNNVERKINVSAAKKFFGIGMKRIQEAEDELLNLQIIRCEGTSHKKGVRYVLQLENDLIWEMYPQTKGICLVEDMSVSKKNRYTNSSKKAEEKKDVEKDSFNPQDKLQDAVTFLRDNSQKGISYKDCEDFKTILPNGNWTQFNSIQKMLEQLEILVPVGVRGDKWFFNDPEDGVSIHEDPVMNRKVVEPEVIKDTDVQIFPVANKEEKISLTEGNADSITVNCYRKDVKYRIMKSSNGYVIDIM